MAHLSTGSKIIASFSVLPAKMRAFCNHPMTLKHLHLSRSSVPVLGLILIGLAALGLRAEEVPTRKHLEITGSHTLRITYDCTFSWPGGGGYSAVFHLPIPPETGAQHIEHFVSSLKGQTETNDAVPPQKLLTATLTCDRDTERRVHWRVQITGQFQTRQLVDGPPAPSATPITAPAPGEFLASTESINWDTDAFRAWLDSSGLRRTDNESPVDYGARVYTYFENHGRYEYPPVSAWNAAAVCQRLRTDCGGFSLVFAAACRANKIPARLLVGQCFKARQQADGAVELTGDRQAHVIAEFFDPQIGWIPEDISSTFLKTPGYPNLNFFGRDPGYFFAWHIDNDFHFDLPRKANAHIQWIQNPAFWFSENADDANDTVSHHWDVETVK